MDTEQIPWSFKNLSTEVIMSVQYIYNEFCLYVIRAYN